ncbi:MAG: nuclear transport factor 2 family protein [Candidatus Bipolaricaulia bacterium]
MDRNEFGSWIEGYIKAWNSNDPEEIGGLFAEDGLYYTEPYAEPWRGRQEIVTEWLGRKDEPGTFEFRYEILGVYDNLSVLRGWTKYLDPVKEYSNIWIVRLNENGQCTEFTEFWMKHE